MISQENVDRVQSGVAISQQTRANVVPVDALRDARGRSRSFAVIVAVSRHEGGPAAGWDLLIVDALPLKLVHLLRRSRSNCRCGPYFNSSTLRRIKRPSVIHTRKRTTTAITAIQTMLIVASSIDDRLLLPTSHACPQTLGSLRQRPYIRYV